MYRLLSTISLKIIQQKPHKYALIIYHKKIIQKRTMFAASATRKIIPSGVFRQYTTIIPCKVPKVLANDGTSKHTHVVEQTCILEDCDTKKCLNLCSSKNTFRILGHNTHKPPVGRLTRFISEQDADGNLKTQYFVPSNKKIEITEHQHGFQIKTNLKTKSYIDKHSDKYEQ